MKHLNIIWIGLVVQALAFAQLDVRTQLVDNVVIILDASGSMNTKMGPSTRMVQAKAAISQLVKTLATTHHVGLLVFSNQGARDWVIPLGPVNPAQVDRVLPSVRAGGGTPLGAFMQKARKVLLEKRQAQSGYGTSRMLIVTDGDASDGKVMKSSTRVALNNGIFIDVVGVAMKNDHYLAAQANSYRRANDSKSLQQAVSKVFAEIGDQAGSDESQEAFDTIAALSDAWVSSALKGLGTLNQDDLPKDPRFRGASPKTPSATRAPQPPPRAGSSANPGGASSRSSGAFSSFKVFFMVMVIVIIVLSAMMKRKNR